MHGSLLHAVKPLAMFEYINSCYSNWWKAKFPCNPKSEPLLFLQKKNKSLMFWSLDKLTYYSESDPEGQRKDKAAGAMTF